VETRDNIFNNLDKLIKQVIGEEWSDTIDVNMESIFSKDLEMESIEIVELAEKIKGSYGDRIDFVKWLSSMELDQIINLKVGEVVEYIHSCLSSSQTE